jgi:hypothetical protein
MVVILAGIVFSGPRAQRYAESEGGPWIERRLTGDTANAIGAEELSGQVQLP